MLKQAAALIATSAFDFSDKMAEFNLKVARERATILDNAAAKGRYMSYKEATRMAWSLVAADKQVTDSEELAKSFKEIAGVARTIISEAL